MPTCHWYHTGTALYMHWYCGYCLYTGTSHSMSLYQYVTGATLVLLFICTGTVGTVGTLILATQCYWYCTGTALYMYWYCGYSWYIGTSHSYVCVPICYWYYTGTALYMYWYCGYCWYTGTSNSMSPCLCYWYHTGTAAYMYWYCWYIGTSDSMSLFLCVSVSVWLLCPVPVWLLCLCACVAVVSLCLCCYLVVCRYVFVAVGSPSPFVHHLPAHLCCVHIIIIQMKSSYCHVNEENSNGPMGLFSR